jgi:hypothetical protein
MWWLRPLSPAPLEKATVCAALEPGREQMAASLRNLLILGKYYSGGLSGLQGDRFRPGLMAIKGMSNALSSPKETR